MLKFLEDKGQAVGEGYLEPHDGGHRLMVNVAGKPCPVEQSGELAKVEAYPDWNEKRMQYETEQQRSILRVESSSSSETSYRR